MPRLEQVQHTFLIWLCTRCRWTQETKTQQMYPSSTYQDLLDHFGILTLAVRRKQQDIMLIRNIYNHAIHSSFLLSKFSLPVPTRQLRYQTLFHVPSCPSEHNEKWHFLSNPRAYIIQTTEHFRVTIRNITDDKNK